VTEIHFADVYQMLSDGNTKAANAKLSSRHVRQGFNVFKHIPCIVSDLPKPDLLHSMHISMLSHVQKWIFHFMTTYERLDKYNAIWLSVSAYPNLTSKNKSYEEVSPWNGKEMKEMSRYLLGVVTQSLREGSPTQRPIFNGAIECTQALLEFYMYARYQSHDDATLSSMEATMCRVRTFKDVFFLGRAGRKSKARANTVRMAVVKKRKVHNETNVETGMPSKKQRQMNIWQDYISHEIDVSKELDANFNFPQIHLMSH
jgi:hypothetical protein